MKLNEAKCEKIMKNARDSKHLIQNKLFLSLIFFSSTHKKYDERQPQANNQLKRFYLVR